MTHLRLQVLRDYEGEALVYADIPEKERKYEFGYS
jgi:hypothetical protein